MKKIATILLLYISIASCCKQIQTFDPKVIAEECMRKHAYHPDELKVLSCNSVLRPERIKCDTFYHIEAVNGDPISHREWRNVKTVYTDSMRIETRHIPEHYYCYASIECVNDCGEIVHGTGKVAVFMDGTAIMYDTFHDRYYKPTSETTHAQKDTISDVRDIICYLDEWNGWLCKQMIFKFHAQ